MPIRGDLKKPISHVDPRRRAVELKPQAEAANNGYDRDASGNGLARHLSCGKVCDISRERGPARRPNVKVCGYLGEMRLGSRDQELIHRMLRYMAMYDEL